MVLYRDLGFISQEQYEDIEKKCAGKGQDLPDDCVDAMDKVNLKIIQIDDLVDGFNIYDAFKPCY